MHPVLVACISRATLVRRMGRRNEENTIKLEAIRRRTRDRKVCRVNGIESAAENREFHTRSIFTERTLTSLRGRSLELRANLEIFSTTS